jgi:hypothetical protein
LNEEIFAKSIGIQMARQNGEAAEAKAARAETLLVQQTTEARMMKTEQSEHHAMAIRAQSTYVQSLRTIDGLRTEYGEALQDLQEESIECEAESNYGYEENRLYIETYELYQNVLCSTPSPTTLPPGLPAVSAGSSTTRVTAPPVREPRVEDSTLKVKEADKLHAPAYPTITNLASWQSNLTQQLVQTSGVRDVQTIIEWITAVWTTGAKIEDFADSGGAAYVTLDVKLSTAMQLIISHGGQEAKELKDSINRKMDEALKKMMLLKGRQIVFMLLENFKTFDNSEMVYGFDHLARCECDKDLSAFMTQWQRILDNMCAPIPTVNLRDVFYRKIKHVEVLKQDMNIYERYRENNANKTRPMSG